MLFFLIQTQFVVSYTISTIVMTFCFNNDTSILQWNNLFDVNGINIQLLIVSYFSTIFPSNPIYHLYFVSYYFHCCIINILEQYWNIKQSKGSPLALWRWYKYKYQPGSQQPLHYIFQIQSHLTALKGQFMSAILV